MEESAFLLLYEASVVIPAEVGIEKLRLFHFDEEWNEALMHENLGIVEEEKEIAHLRAEKY